MDACPRIWFYTPLQTAFQLVELFAICAALFALALMC